MRKEYGSEFYLDIDAIAESPRRHAFNYPGGGSLFFRAGRDAIRYLAINERDKCGAVALLPSLCCDSMSEPFAREGYKVVFYAVDSNLEIDEDDLVAKAAENPGALLLYMSYFGISPISPDAVADLKARASLTVVRDATHDVLGRRVDADGADDYVLASLRKWTGLPDGAILYSSHRGLAGFHLEPDDSFVALRKDAMMEKLGYLQEADGASKPHYMAQLAECNAVLDEMGGPYAMSGLSRDIMERTDWGALGETRKRNAKALVARLEAAGLRCYCDTSVPPLYVPIVLENRDAVQKRCAWRDVYLPVLWPLPEGAEECGGFAAEFSEKMLAVPCDQRYDVDDMHLIAVVTIEAVSSL